MSWAFCDYLDDLSWVSRCWKKRGQEEGFKEEALEDVGSDWIDKMMERWWGWINDGSNLQGYIDRIGTLWESSLDYTIG